MKKIISIALLMCTLFLGNVAGQQISAEAFNKEVIHEDFNQIGNIFKIVTTTDNYFILDNGDYLLSRNNNESEYAIIANKSFSSDFVLKTQLRIGPSINQKASIGIILKAQEDGKGAMIFEINTKGEYRVKQLKGSSYSTLSGNKQNNGWIRNKIVNSVDNHNLVEIRTEDNIFDVYINNNYITTFFMPDYTSGYAGLIITAATKARVSYFYLNEKNKVHQIEKDVNDNNESTTIEDLNKKILEERNAKLNESNTETKGIQNKESTNLNVATAELKERIKAKEKEILTIKQQLSTEQAINTELTEDLNKSTSANSSISTQLNKEISNLQSKINSLEKSKTKLTEKLSSERNAHTKTKDALSIVVTNKDAKIKALETQLNKELFSLTKIQTEHSSTITASLLNNVTLSATVDNLNGELMSLKNEIKELNITNADLKDLFVLKDFEVNGVKPSELTTQTQTHVPSAPKVTKGNKTVYAVQFGVYMTIQSYTTLKDLDEIWYETTKHGTYVYLSGKFKSPQEATEHKNSLMTLGYPNAFVVIFTK